MPVYICTDLYEHLDFFSKARTCLYTPAHVQGPDSRVFINNIYKLFYMIPIYFYFCTVEQLKMRLCMCTEKEIHTLYVHQKW